MGAFSIFASHTKIRKNTHICNFIALTNVLIINIIVKLCNNYLSPKLTMNRNFINFLVIIFYIPFSEYMKMLNVTKVTRDKSDIS